MGELPVSLCGVFYRLFRKGDQLTAGPVPGKEFPAEHTCTHTQPAPCPQSFNKKSGRLPGYL